MSGRVVVVGGGITGLATAHALAKKGRGDVVLLEADGRLGGKIITERRDGFILDGGPDSWVASKPQATTLAKEVGLGDHLMPTNEATRRVYVAQDGALHPIPEGLVLGVPTRILPVLRTRLFSWRGKLRMGLEPFVPRRKSDDDESIEGFIIRRLGREVNDRLAAPLLGGIFAGDAAKLSLRATFPQFVAMEEKHGSLVRAMHKMQRDRARAAAKGDSESAFLSVTSGMGSFIDAVAARLDGVEVRTGARVRRVGPGGDARYAVELENGEVLAADHVVLGTPAYAAAAALRDLDAGVADTLAEFLYVSTATVFLAFRRADVPHPLDAVGFIVPRASGRPILAGTFVSSKWKCRAPEGHVLLRAFFGGAWGEEQLEKSDDGLIATARGELRTFIGLEKDPLFARVFRFTRANPQPTVGHAARLAKLRAGLARLPGIYVAGSGIDGIGIPDCVRQGGEVAEAILGSA